MDLDEIETEMRELAILRYDAPCGWDKVKAMALLIELAEAKRLVEDSRSETEE